MRLTLTVTFLVLLCAAPAWGGDDSADRAQILQAEMSRQSEDLEPYLAPDVAPALRRLAIRALGRIGNDGRGIGILRDMLATETSEARLVLWAAGIAMDKALAGPLTERIARHAEAREYDLAAQAAASLGWTGAEGIVKTLVHYVDHENATLRTGALLGLGRARAPERAALMMASVLASHPDAGVRAAADYACWLMAARQRAEAVKADESWDGDEAIALHFMDHLKAAEPERRMAGIRVLGSMLPAICLPDGNFGAIYGLLDDPDPRVVQDAIWRIFTRREGNHSDAALGKALGHPDAKVRHLAAEALGKHATPNAIGALAARWDVEPDARVREVLAVELVRCGKEAYAQKLLARSDRAKDPVVRQLTDVNLLLVSPRPEALGELMQWADPGASQRAGLHAATWMAVLGGLQGKQHAKLDEWLLGFLGGGYGVDKPDRHHVIASAVSLAGTNKRHGLGKVLLAMLGRTYSGPPHDEVQQAVLHAEIRKALLGAFAELAADEDCPKAIATAMRAAVVRHMHKDPSPWVRLAAREAAAALGVEDVPAYDDVGRPNTWRGLPYRVTVPDETADGGRRAETRWMDAAQILALADWIADSGLRVVFGTTAGSFVVELDARAAPVHCVSLLNAVRDGLYTDTRWHRVVPNFVIQGCDPHGHGGGDGGWTVPDEITENRYERGALGMPKSVKDDGGCQVFVMHSGYRPLDERYTCYGRVVEGMKAVDAIRVGDFTRVARIVIGR